LSVNSDIFIRLAPFPAPVKAVVTANDDGTYNVYVNEQLGDEERRLAVDHEIEHIKRGHLFRETPVALDEAEANAEKPSR